MKKGPWLVALLVVGIWLLLPSRGRAAETGLKVTPIQAASQRDKTEAFFDLVLQPGRSETLDVQLQNVTARNQVVDVAVLPASTSDDGRVQYRNEVKFDPSLRDNLKDMVEAPNRITVPAGKTILYHAKITMPKRTLPGMVAGAMIFTPEKTNDATTTNMGVTNNFQYSVGILARNENRSWQPNLSIAGVSSKQQANMTSIAVRFRNTTATFLNQLTVETTVSKAGKTYSRNQSDMQMAPNSTFDYSVPLDAKPVAGRYDVTATAYYVKDNTGRYQDVKGQHYRFRKTTVTSVELRNQNRRSPRERRTIAKNNLPISITIGLSMIAVLMVIILVLISLVMKGRRKI